MEKPSYTYMHIRYLLILLFLTHISATSQSPFIQKISYPLPTREPVFTVACQDNEGFIWLGSDNGLYRFDGISFKQYLSLDTRVDYQVSSLCVSPSGVLWIGCKDGSIYYLENDKLLRFDPDEGTTGLTITDILVDGEEVLWWSTPGEGIYFFSNDRVYNINREDGLSDDYVYDLEPDDTGWIFAGTDAGISLVRQEENRKIVKSPELNQQLPDLIVHIIKKDPAGGLWLGFYDNGINQIDGLQIQKKIPSWPYGPVKDLIVRPDAIWVATTTGEILETDPLAPELAVRIAGPASSDFGRINDMLEDTEGNIWILSTSGLYRTTGTKLSSYQYTQTNGLKNIHAITADKINPDMLWFSNDDGLFRLHQKTGTVEIFLTNPPMNKIRTTCLYQDDHGNIWAGTFNFGAFKINPKDGSWVQFSENDGLVNNNVLSISGHRDTIWMATLGGATELVTQAVEKNGMQRIRSFNRENGLVSNYIYAVYEDHDNRIWFATDGDGISVMDRKGFTSYNSANGLPDDVVYSIAGDRYGNIWIATATAGVLQFDGNRFRRFGTDEGLSSLDISGLVASDDEIVIIQNNGLDILHIPSGRIAHLGEESGLAGLSPGLNVTATDIDGNVWLGTMKGIFRYRPGTSPESFGPKTILEEMSVYMEPVMMKAGLRLGSYENHISFSYTGIYFSNPGKVMYQVMLDGYDLGWMSTFDRAATYSSLPAGEYTFKVRSSLDNSFRNASEASFSFRIIKPFWMQWWFIMLCIASIATGIYLFIRRREEKLRKAEQLKKEKVESEFQILKNQINPHFLFNSFSTLMALIEEKPDQALHYTEKLSDFFRIILQTKDQEVIPLHEELMLVENYFFLLKKRFGDNLRLEIKLEEKITRSFVPPMTLQILVENAVKHNIISREKPLDIKVYSITDKIIVENNLQQKKADEVSTGTGLDNIFRRYKLLTGREPEIREEEGCFKVILPIIEDK